MLVETSIEIAATPEQIWAIMLDVERWPEWTSSIARVERLGNSAAAFGVGSEARILQPGLPVNLWRVTQIEPGHGFVWETRSWGALTRAEHWITPNDKGGSTVLLSVHIRGFLEPLLRPWLTRMTRKNVALEAQGLKRRSEDEARKVA
jgi:uncharacterized protein YndB with AHSA1/START domain